MMKKIIFVSSVSLMLLIGCADRNISNPQNVKVPVGGMAENIKKLLNYDNYGNGLITDFNGVLVFRFNTTISSLRWNKCSNRQEMSNGYDMWCVKNGRPEYFLKDDYAANDWKYVVYMNGGTLSESQWDVEAKKLGFIEPKLYREKKEQERELKNEQDRIKESNERIQQEHDAVTVMSSDIGTTVCQKGYGGYLLNRGYMEDKSKSKIKIRVIWSLVITPRENGSATILWSSPAGWYVCN